MNITRINHRLPPLSGLLIGMALATHASVALAGTEAFDKQMEPILREYLKIPKALAAERTNGVKEAAGKIKRLAARLDPSTVSGEHAGHYQGIAKNLIASADRLAKAADIAAMREALKELSKPMAMWATMSKPKGINVVYCSMAPGSWLQRGTTIANPYYGAKMLRCGEIVSGPGSGKPKKGHIDTMRML